MKRNPHRLPDPGRDLPGDASSDAERLRTHERQAWSTYRTFAAKLDPPCPVEVSDGRAAAPLVSALSRIGVDEAIVRTLLGVAPETWGALEPASGKVVRLYPEVHRAIDEAPQRAAQRIRRNQIFRHFLVWITYSPCRTGLSRLDLEAMVRASEASDAITFRRLYQQGGE